MKVSHLAFDLSAWLFSGKIQIATLSMPAILKNVAFLDIPPVYNKQSLHQKLLKRFLQVLSVGLCKNYSFSFVFTKKRR